jgi:hypothetical protein
MFIQPLQGSLMNSRSEVDLLIRLIVLKESVKI